MLHGTGSPGPLIGAVNDFYIDTTTWTMYGPKTADGWSSTAHSLVGPAGASGANGSNGTNGTNGSDGNTIISGIGAPAAGIGNDGDYFLDTNVSKLYGPKSAGAWPGSGTSLVGPKGDSGSPGAGSLVTLSQSWSGGFGSDGLQHTATLTCPADHPIALDMQPEAFFNDTRADFLLAFVDLSATYTRGSVTISEQATTAGVASTITVLVPCFGA